MNTNTENHPAVIPSITAAQRKLAAVATVSLPRFDLRQEDGETDSGSETERESPKNTVTRPKGETTEERRVRKSEVKAERLVSGSYTTR